MISLYVHITRAFDEKPLSKQEAFSSIHIRLFKNSIYTLMQTDFDFECLSNSEKIKPFLWKNSHQNSTLVCKNRLYKFVELNSIHIT